MWTKLFLLLGLAPFLAVNVAGQCGLDTLPPNPPCGMGSGNLTLTPTAPLSGLCCSIDNKQGSISSFICIQNVLVCDQGYFVPRQNTAAQLNGYSAQLEALRMSWDPSVAGTVGGRVCYERTFASTDGCACLCAILLTYATGLTNCRCDFLS